jgi:hypothetical protein
MKSNSPLSFQEASQGHAELSEAHEYQKSNRGICLALFILLY